jgi:hypothetical protein
VLHLVVARGSRGCQSMMLFQSRYPDHAYIVAGGEITTQARNCIGQRLDAGQRSQILFML